MQIQVDEEWLKLLTIDTHKGLYEFNRLPFRIKVAPGIFCPVMDTLLSDLNLAIAYLDDILIKSENRELHIQHMNKVFRKINEYGFILSDDKFEFFMMKIKYLSQIIKENGRKPEQM